MDGYSGGRFDPGATSHLLASFDRRSDTSDSSHGFGNRAALYLPAFRFPRVFKQYI